MARMGHAKILVALAKSESCCNLLWDFEQCIAANSSAVSGAISSSVHHLSHFVTQVSTLTFFVCWTVASWPERRCFMQTGRLHQTATKLPNSGHICGCTRQGRGWARPWLAGISASQGLGAGAACEPQVSLKLRREEGRYLKVKNRFHDFIAAALCSASCHFPGRSCS